MIHLHKGTRLGQIGKLSDLSIMPAVAVGPSSLVDMLETKIVSPSYSPWPSFVVLARKKDGSLFASLSTTES